MRVSITSVLAAILTLATQGITCTGQAVSPRSYHQLVAVGGMNGITLNAVGFMISESFMTEPPQWGGGLPGGDYQATCRDMRMNGSLLQANCQKRDGGWRSTSLDTRSCNRGIINDNGYLRCPDVGGQGNDGGRGHGRGGIPPGDYRATCRDIRVSGQRLDATCQKEDGNWRNTSLNNFSRCGNQISNVDGHLRCGR